MNTISNPIDWHARARQLKPCTEVFIDGRFRAALSGDQLMMDAYRSGDPYLAFAKQAGAAPADATSPLRA